MGYTTKYGSYEIRVNELESGQFDVAVVGDEKTVTSIKEFPNQTQAVAFAKKGINSREIDGAVEYPQGR